MQVFRRIDRFEPRGNGAMRAYLRQALRNRLVNVRRDASRRPLPVSLDDFDVSVEAASPLDKFLSDAQRERYLAALAGLTPEEREAIVVRFELGYSFEQLRVALGKPSPDAASMAVRRAVVRLTETMHQ